MSQQQSLQLKTRVCHYPVKQQLSGLHPVLQRVFCARGIRSIDEIDYALDALVKPPQITHLSQAAALLSRHIEASSQVLIFGDYDADGATSTALCVSSLTQFGHTNVSFYLPDRVIDGYGVSEHVAQTLIDLKPDLVITVDTGIASFGGLERLAKAGIEVIVTDHHLAANELPSASVIVNPNAFELSAGKNLAGVGVAFYLMLATRSELRSTGWFSDRAEPNLADNLGLVAIGTIADLVPLDYNNRILVSEGLKRLRANLCSCGITQLIEFSGRNQKTLSAQDIAFSVAPRINAAGRLDDMTIGVQALLANDDKSANALVSELDNINKVRREMQGSMTQQAMSMVPEIGDLSGRFSCVLYQPDWHEGIVGIIASKIKDITFRPSISFASSADTMIKGSCRSIPGIHIRDMLDLVDKSEPGLIIRFGGHAMAAGLTIRKDQLTRFSECFENVLRQHVDPACFNNIIECDGELESADLSLDFAYIIQNAGPWGQRFPVPSFSGLFKVQNQKVLADRHLKFELTHPDSSNRIDAILFYADDQDLKTNFETLQIHYELSVNDFRGECSVQLIIRHIL